MDPEAELTSHDGACRDINLFGSNSDGVTALLVWLVKQFAEHSGTASLASNHVEPVSADGIHAAVGRVGGDRTRSLRGYLSGACALFDHLQYFVSPQEEGWFVELTFFPADLHLQDGIATLEAWVRDALSVCGGHGALVRYENASVEPSWEERRHREVVLVIEPSQ